MPNFDRELLLSEIVKAVGEKIGDSESRNTFALAVLRRLSGAVPAAANIATHRRDVKAVSELSRNAHRAVRALRANRCLERMKLESKCCFGAYRRRGVDGLDLKVIEDFLMDFASRADSEAGRLPSNAPTRDNSASVYLAGELARLYWEHFGRRPSTEKSGHVGKGVNRSTVPRKSPFDRVCDVVNDLLTQLGRKIVITSTARQKALAN